MLFALKPGTLTAWASLLPPLGQPQLQTFALQKGFRVCPTQMFTFAVSFCRLTDLSNFSGITCAGMLVRTVMYP